MEEELSGPSTNCRRLKMIAEDRKKLSLQKTLWILLENVKSKTNKKDSWWNTKSKYNIFA